MANRPVDAEAQLTIGEAGGVRVDRHQAAGMDGWTVTALVIGPIEEEVAALLHQLAAEGDRVAGRDADAGDAMAQPRCLDGACGIPDGRLELFQASGQVLHFQPFKNPQHRSIALEKEVGNRCRRWVRDMACGEVEQQVPDRFEAEPRVQPGTDGADAFEVLDGRVQRDAVWRRAARYPFTYCGQDGKRRRGHVWQPFARVWRGHWLADMRDGASRRWRCAEHVGDLLDAFRPVGWRQGCIVRQ